MLRSAKVVVASCAAAVLIKGDAAAQERPVPLDTVRVTVASLASPGLAASTRGVQVVTAEEISRLPATTVADVLQWAMGVDVMPRSPALVDVGMRGSTFEQVLVLVDGVRVSDAQTGHFDLNLAVPLDQVERIEVLRGAASAVHGSDAVGGGINIVTGRGAGTRARLQGGSFGTVDAGVTHTGSVQAASFTAGADLSRSDGHRPGTDHEVLQGRLSVQAPLGEQTMELAVARAHRDFGARGFYGSNPDWDEYEQTRTTTATLSLRAPVDASFALEPTLTFRRNGDDFLLMRDDPSFYRNVHTTDQLGGQLIARWAAAPELRMAAGAELYHDALESTGLGDRQETRGGVLTEVAAGRVGALTASAGARLDWHDRHGAFLSPSLSAGWWPLPTVRLRGSVTRALRTPTWTERYYRDPANEGSADLDPERSWSTEIGVDLEPLPAARLGVALFQRSSSGLIDWARPVGDDEGIWVTSNVDRARFRGVEADASVVDATGGRWSLQGSWLSVRSSTPDGIESKYALRPLVESVTAGVDRPVGERLGFTLRGTRARRMGEEAYLRIDGRAALQVRSFGLHLDVRNLTDSGYLDVTRTPSAGRSVAVGVEWVSQR